MWWGCECVLDPEKCAKANAKCVGEMAWNSNRCKCEQKSFVSRLKPGFVWKNSKYVLTEVEQSVQNDYPVVPAFPSQTQANKRLINR